MSTTYPGTIQTFTNPAGTNTLSSPDHATLHTNMNDTVGSIQSVLGTTAGTGILKNFAAGDFPARINSSNVLQHVVQGTLGTPTVVVGSDATGDLYYRSSSGNVARVGIGTAGQLLTTNGTTPTWANSTNYLARAFNGTAQSIASGSVLQINLDTESYDPNSNFATATYTAPVSGYYACTGGVQFVSISDAKLIQVFLTINGTIKSRNSTTTGVGGQAVTTQVTDILRLSSGDVVNLKATHNEGSALNTSSSEDGTFFAIALRTTY